MVIDTNFPERLWTIPGCHVEK